MTPLSLFDVNLFPKAINLFKFSTSEYKSKVLKVIITSTLSAIGLSLSSCQQVPQYGYIEGETMGTSYHIRYKQPDNLEVSILQQAIDKRLVALNNSMSTYQEDSTISKFNKLPQGASLQIESDFNNVYQDSKQVYQLSGGAFDPTVMPLINLWGFGKVMTVDRLQNPPTDTEIAVAKSLLGFESVAVKGSSISKTKEGVALDFSAVAKGYGVDVIADMLDSQYKINNYMVEIGGEVATSGVNQSAQPWHIAIDAPVLDTSVNERVTLAVIRQPRGQSLHLATSGNYRNSVVYNGKRYSHTIDPTTGQPIVGGAPSVSVVAETVSLADAWATALTAMPYEKALSTANEHHLAALFIVPKAGHINDKIPTLEDLEQSNTNPLSYWSIVETSAMQTLRSSN